MSVINRGTSNDTNPTFDSNLWTLDVSDCYYKNARTNKTLAQCISTYPEWLSSNFSATPNWNKHIIGTGIVCVNSNPDTITDSGNGFVAVGFEAGDQIMINGTSQVVETKTIATNLDVYTIVEVALGTITLEGGDQLTAQSAGDTISVFAVKPVGSSEYSMPIKSISPAIDTGAYLTTITSNSGTGTSFVVADALYFYDGWGISGETGDVIGTESGKVTTIQTIDYSSRRITVEPAINFVRGEGVALDYCGSRPDVGVHEYGSAASESDFRSPQKMRVVSPL